MRTDVKVGVVLSLVVVVAAGWYFLRSGSQEDRIPLDAQVTGTDAEADAQPPPAVIRREPSRRASAERAASQRPTRDRAPGSTGARPRPANESARKPAVIPDTAVAAGPVEQPTPATDPLADLVRHGQDTGGTADRADEPPATEQPEPGESPTELTGGTPSADAVPRLRPPRSRLPGRAGRSTEIERTRGEREGQARLPTRTTAGPTGQARPPSGPPLAATPEPAARTHTVEPGDTFSVLAEAYYGSQRHTGFLIQANPQVKDPNRLLVGTVINIPPLARRETGAAVAAAQPGTYRVREGDTFYGIARDVLGDTSRWKELLELNSSVVDGDPRNLRVGQVLKLPSDAGSG